MNSIRRRTALGLFALFIAAGTGAPAVRAGELPRATEFRCEDAFDVLRLVTTARCAATPRDSVGTITIESTREKLVALGLLHAADLNAVSVRWCPLNHALGFTASAEEIYIDSSLAHGSLELSAEVLAHEMIHVAQFRRLGAQKFKCDYVRDYLACGACQDRSHPLEAEAYEFQDRVREKLVESWLR